MRKSGDDVTLSLALPLFLLFLWEIYSERGLVPRRNPGLTLGEKTAGVAVFPSRSKTIPGRWIPGAAQRQRDESAWSENNTTVIYCQ